LKEEENGERVPQLLKALNEETPGYDAESVGVSESLTKTRKDMSS
jgi:hypothetical protein